MNRDTSNLTLFVESACSDHRLLQKADISELKEALTRCPTRIKESASDSPSGWWVPISFYNKVNGNRRNYTKRLWENVRDKQKDTWCGSAMLCDHPSGDSDGNPKDICGVWLDMKLGDPDQTGKGLVFGLLMPSGRNGEDLQSHLQNGLKIGTSSSGFGKLMSDGVTVDPDTYVIERLADWVLNPSQGTFFSYNENNEVEDRSMRESDKTEDRIEERSNFIGSIRDTAERYMRVHPDAEMDEVVDAVRNTYPEEGFTRETIERFVKDYYMNESNNTKETIMKDSAKLTKLEEKKFRRDMESFLESANSIRDPQERLEELKDIREYFEDGACPDLREKVEQKITEQEALIKQMLSERLEMKEELGVDSVRELKEKLTEIADNVKLTEKEAKDWKQISEQLQDKLTEATNNLNSRPTEAFVSFQKEKIDKLAETLKEHDTQAADVVKSLSESYKTLKEEKDTAEDKAEQLEKDKATLEESVKSYEEKLTESTKSLDELTEKFNELSAKYKTALKELSLFKKLVGKNRELFEKAIKSNEDFKESQAKSEQTIEHLNKDIKSAKIALKESVSKKALEDIANMTETEKYFESLYEQYGSDIEPFRSKIVNAVTLAEAKKIFFSDVLSSMKESQDIEKMRLPESISMSMEDRAMAITKEPLKKTSSLSRMPKGWM